MLKTVLDNTSFSKGTHEDSGQQLGGNPKASTLHAQTVTQNTDQI